MVMKKSDSKKIALNVYLLKPKTSASGGVEYLKKDEFLSKSIDSNGKAHQVKADVYRLGDEGKSGSLYVRKPYTESVPEWINFVSGGLDLVGHETLKKLKNKSVSALLIATAKQRQFAIAFGHGRHMLDPKCIEHRFGIKVVLNSISPEKIASLDKQTFEALPRLTRTQAVRAAPVSDYAIDAEQDLLRALVGFTKSDYSSQLGDVLAGMDSLKTTVGIELAKLSDFLEVALERSNSKDYLKKGPDGQMSAFAWVDNLEAVTEKTLVGQLDGELWKLFDKGEFSAMWLAVPEIFDWEKVTGFAYTQQQLGEPETLSSKMDIDDFKDSLRADATLETLKNRVITMVMSTGEPPQTYPAYKCIYSEVTYKKATYILNAGSWYHVEAVFEKSVQKFYKELPRLAMGAPFLEYDHDGEGPYNEAVSAAQPKDYAMLDRDLIQFGGKHSKIETCDLFFQKTSGAVKSQFIHVKRGRSSASLSHLFAQGLVSSTLLVREPAYAEKVNEQLTKKGFQKLPSTIEGKHYEVIYAIIDGPSTATLDIPFFSKVNLHSCCGNLKAYGFDVRLLHIPESASYLAAQKRIKTIKVTARKAVKVKAGKVLSAKPVPKRPTTLKPKSS